jgi:hypothetical protein
MYVIIQNILRKFRVLQNLRNTMKSNDGGTSIREYLIEVLRSTENSEKLLLYSFSYV